MCTSCREVAMVKEEDVEMPKKKLSEDNEC
jgi:hypothetical protein